MNYVPTTDRSWEHIDAATAGFDPGNLDAAITYAETHETSWPYDLEDAGNVPGLSQFEKPPWNEALGIFKPRGGPNGLLLKGGRIVGQCIRINPTGQRHVNKRIGDNRWCAELGFYHLSKTINR